MPRLRLALLPAVRLALAAPATAPAALRIGIAENTPNLFSDPLFQALGAKYARVAPQQVRAPAEAVAELWRLTVAPNP